MATVAPIGKVIIKHSHSQAKVDTDYMGMRYKFSGPPRGDDEQQAHQDLVYIRAAAEGSPTRVQGLQAMQTAAKLLRDEAKALARGGVGQDAAGSYYARFRYIDAGITEKRILGPPRQGEHRAETDLAVIREAALEKKTWPEQITAMQHAAQRLREKAQFENSVARGVAQYEAQKQAHKAADSYLESSGDEDDGADDEYYGLDNAAIAKMVKELPPLRPQPPPPVDVNDANVQLACFRFSLEKPETLEAILLARADPNLLVGDGDISPLQKAMLFTRDQKDVVRMRELLLEHGASESAYERLRWNERRAADAGEPAWLRNFHRSA